MFIRLGEVLQRTLRYKIQLSLLWWLTSSLKRRSLLLHCIMSFLLSTGPKRSPWSGGRPYSDKLSFLDSHGWSNVVYYTPCFCAMDSSVRVPNHPEGCRLEQVLILFQSFEVIKVLKSVSFGCVWIHRYEHPLLVPEREKSEWVLPITVHAPPSRTSSSPAQNRGDKLYGLEPSWIRS